MIRLMIRIAFLVGAPLLFAMIKLFADEGGD